MDIISREERQEKIAEAGLHVACYREKQSHAICMHGVIAEIHTDHHSCRWLPLARNEGMQRRGGNTMTTKREFIDYLETLPEHTEIEVIVQHDYYTFEKLVIGKNTSLDDMCSNPYAKGKSYENAITLYLGED